MKNLPDPLLNNIIKYLKNDDTIIQLLQDLKNIQSSYHLLEEYSDERDMEHERLLQQNNILERRLTNMQRQYQELYEYIVNNHTRRRLDFEIMTENSDNE